MKNLLETVSAIGIVPVIRIDDPADTIPLAKALYHNGLPIAEITFRSSHAKAAIEAIHNELPDMLLGAGTVLTIEQVDDAIVAGAEFIVTPGFNPEIVSYCIKNKINIIPGCSNASDIEKALSFGLTTVKFFPAEQLGGLSMIKALAGPYTNVNFMPTGGISACNLNDYLSYDKIVACGGTWMVDKKMIANKDFDGVGTLTKQAVYTMLGLKLKHVAINANPSTSRSIAEKYATLFGGIVRETSKGFFGSEFIEVMNDGVGTYGHIAIGCNDVKRAKRYFIALGFTFDETTAVMKNNKLDFIYFNEEIGGFKVHLISN